MAKDSQAPPIYIWLFVLAFFIGVQGWIFFYPERLSAQNETFSLQERRSLAQLEVIKIHYANQCIRKPDAYHVVVIGSSITNNSIACTDVWLAESKARLGEEIVVTKFFSPGRPLRIWVEQGDLTELLVASKPDLVLVEEELLTYSFRRVGIKEQQTQKRFHQKPNGDGLLAKWDAKRLTVTRMLQQNRLNVMASLQNQRLQTAPPYTSHPCGNMIVSPQLGDTTLIKPRKRFIIPFDKQDYSHRFIQGLQELGIDIVLLHHPRSVQLEAMYEATPEAEGISDLIGKFQQNYDIPYWRCPLQFPYRYYRDQAHMNHIGRKKYDSWLLTKIAQYKKDS